ncbi:MAG: aminopeptidase [Pseudomonadota bacterium]
MNDIKLASMAAVKDCLGVKANESVLILTDHTCLNIANSIFKVANDLANEVYFLQMKERQLSGENPPKEIAELMKAVDVVFAPLSKSITHTDATIDARKAGVRVATMPGITEDIFSRCMNVNYNEIAVYTKKVAKLLESKNQVHVKTALGTDFRFSIKDSKLIESNGLYTEKGSGGNLPTGEVFCAPRENYGTGKLVVDGTIAGVGLVKNPVTIEIEDGYIINVDASEDGKKLKAILLKFGNKLGSDNQACGIAELGIGTNFAAKLSGFLLEDEKAYKTIHIAFGNNKSMGGTNTVESHIDGVILNPDLFVDGEQIMRHGEVLF